MRHIISVVVEDKFGALARIVELFTSRGYNLDSLCTGECEQEGTHRISLVATGDDGRIDHIIKLLNNIVNVFEVIHLHPTTSISKELMLVKMKIAQKKRGELLQLIDALQGTILELNHNTLCFQVVGSASNLDGIVQILREYEIVELARTGEAAIQR